MDNGLFFGVLAYLFISSFIAGVLPDSLYSGTQNPDIDSEEFREIATSEIDEVDGFTGQLSFFGKVLRFLFVTWVIQGIPLFFATFLLFVNIISLLIIGIWSYDKIRGIS